MKKLAYPLLAAALAAVLAAVTATAGEPSATAGTTPPTKEQSLSTCKCYGPDVDMDGDQVLDRYDQCVNTPKGCIVDPWGCSTDADGDGVCDGVDQCPDTPKGVKVDALGCSEEQRMAMKQAKMVPPPPPAPAPVPPPAPPAPAPVQPPQTATELQLMTGNLVLEDVYFETSSTVLKPESAARLDEVGAALEKMPGVKLEIQGHTDSRGASAFNQKLSQGRAESVRQYLLDHFKLDGGDLAAVGHGESRLRVSPETSPEDYAKNRRVEVKVLNPEALPKGVQVEHR